jgi:hypothetical protein
MGRADGLSEGNLISAAFGCIEATVPLPVDRSRSCRKRVVLPASHGPTIKTDAPRGPEAKRRKMADIKFENTVRYIIHYM